LDENSFEHHASRRRKHLNPACEVWEKVKACAVGFNPRSINRKEFLKTIENIGFFDWHG